MDGIQMVPIRFPYLFYDNVRNYSLPDISGVLRGGFFTSDRQIVLDFQSSLEMGLFRKHLPRLGSSIRIRILWSYAHFSIGGNYRNGNLQRKDLVLLLPYGNDDPGYMSVKSQKRIQRRSDRKLSIFRLKKFSLTPVILNRKPPKSNSSGVFVCNGTFISTNQV